VNISAEVIKFHEHLASFDPFANVSSLIIGDVVALYDGDFALDNQPRRVDILM
jgi:hypothetical protein